MGKFWHTLTMLGIAAVVVLLDQLSKAWVRAALPRGASWAPWSSWLPWVRIVHWHNRGAAFGMFQQGGPLFAILAVVAVLLIGFYLPRTHRDPWPVWLGLALILGGALGNLADRLTRGVVTDFIAVGAFPVFNLADASITLGAIAVVLGGWRTRGETAPTPEGPEPDPLGETAPDPVGAPDPQGEHRTHE